VERKPSFPCRDTKRPEKALNLPFGGKKSRQEIKVKVETGRTVFFTRKKGLAVWGTTALSLALPAFPFPPKIEIPPAQVWRLTGRISFKFEAVTNLPSQSNPRKRKLETPQAIDHYPGLTAATRRIYACLVEHARGKGRCWPSRRRIAEQAGCCLRSVSNATRKLESLGLLRRVSVYDSHRQIPNTYYLLDLQPLEEILSPAKKTPKHYIPGKPVEKLSAPLFCKGEGSHPLSTQGTTPIPPSRGMETATRRPRIIPDGPRIAQDRQTPRRTHRQPRIDPGPKTPQEAAIWSRCLDEPVGYSDLPGNRRRLRQILDKGGVELLRRLLDLSLRPWVKEPGAYLQVLVRNVF